MKKYGFENLTKRSKILWKKIINKKIKIKAKLIAGAATKKPPLSSILASININAENVINTFNTQTINKFEPDALLRTIIKIDLKKNFIINYNLPTTYELIKKLSLHKYYDNLRDEEFKLKKKLSVIAYKISIAKLSLYQLKKIPIYAKMRQIYGSIKSWDVYNQADHKKDKKRHKKKK